MELRLEHLHKRYGNFTALGDISYTFTAGVYGLLGPNGAGKSTTLNLIVNNLCQDGGVIRLDGTDIRREGTEYLAKVGYMPQQQNLYPGFTGRQFLYFMSSLKGLKKPEAREQIAQLVEKLNMKEYIGKRIKSYSGGMKQRLLIAQALLGDPEILVLDEPTAGLDPKERVRIRNLISKESRHRIVLLATHVVTDVDIIASEILLMKEGAILDHGTPEELKAKVAPFVYAVRVNGEQLNQLEEKYLFSSVEKLESDLYLARIIAQFPPEQEHEPVRPTLDDVYMYYFGEM